MSAIFGFSRETQDFFKDSCVEEMGRSLSHRGADEVWSWIGDETELGHRLNGMPSESRRDKKPIHDAASNLVIACDSRLDNRDELLSRLTISGRNEAKARDSQIILAAYHKWAESCVNYLDGDFAFAIWDPRRSQLFAARDRLGVKPLCYFASRKGFAFASEIKALLVSDSVSANPDEKKLGWYLLDIPLPADETFYEGIRRLPPAHWLVYRRGITRVQRYWELSAGSELKLSSNGVYAEAMQSELSKAVRNRLRTDLKVGSMLSGGLDSSTVASLAAGELGLHGRRLETFSNIFDNVPECDESAYIRQVLDDETMTAHFCPGDASGPLTDIDSMLRTQDGPFAAPGLYLNCRLNAAAESEGVRVLLDGHGGDETVSLGHNYPNELARQGRYIALWRECRGLAAAYEDSTFGLFRTYAASAPFIAAAKKSSFYRSARGLLAPRRRKDSPDRERSIKWLSVLNQDFCARHTLIEECRSQAARHPSLCNTDREAQLRILTSPAQASAVETLDRSAAAFRIEPRFPFLDRHLMEFCLSLPAAQKLHDGWSRVVMRRAMTSLPREVCWRRDKTDLSLNFQRGLRLFDAEKLRSILMDESDRAAGILNLQKLKQNYARYQSESPNSGARDSRMIWKLAVVIRWLGQKRETPGSISRRALSPHLSAYSS